MAGSRSRETEQLQAMDKSFHLHPFTDYKDLNQKGSRVITRAEGIFLWDSDGNRLLDGMAGLWCVNLGYGRKELIEAAYEQLKQLPFYNCFFQSTHPPAAELSKLLVDITQEHLNHVFFTNSGSEANDTVFRMVRRYWEVVGEPKRQVIISRENAYHGSTVAGASLGGMAFMHKQGNLPIPGIEHIPQPYYFADDSGLSEDEFGVKTAAALEERIEALGAENVAAFIAEPIQGAGGVIIPPKTYWPEIQRICNKYNILLVVDEVICGFGRLGSWFGSDYYQLKPDLMPIAKGLSSGYLPIGGVMVGDRVADALINHGGEFYHGFTYSGHPACAAVAIANIKLLQKEKVIERVSSGTGPYLQQQWSTLGDHPLVGEVRGVGFLGAIELVKDKGSKQRFDDDCSAGALCRDICFDNGLVMRAVGDTMVISPPLIMTSGEIDELVGLARKCLDLTAEAIDNGALNH